MKHRTHRHVMWEKWFDLSITYGGLLGSLVTIPQVIEIWSKQSADGVSLLTWGGMCIGNTLWLVYGIVHQEKPLMYAYVCAVPLSLAVVVGAFLF
jgi:uncharacterized protein with PQ loop repeat